MKETRVNGLQTFINYFLTPLLIIYNLTHEKTHRTTLENDRVGPVVRRETDRLGTMSTRGGESVNRRCDQ